MVGFWSYSFSDCLLGVQFVGNISEQIRDDTLKKYLEADVDGVTEEAIHKLRLF